MTKTTRIAAFYLALVFVAGALFGVVADRLYQRSARAASSPQDYRERYIARLQRELVLTPEQVTQVTAILDETGQRFRELREKVGPEFEAIRKAQRERITALLTPAQRPRYEKILEEHRLEREKARHSR